MMFRFVRCDKGTFERAFWNGGVVLVDKNGPRNRQDIFEFHTPQGHTFASTPDLMQSMAGDGPSRSGEGFNYYVCFAEASK